MRFLSLAATALAAATAVLAQTSTVPEGFVTRCGTKFCLDGKPWSFAGANTYDVFTYGSGSGATETQFMDKTKIDRHFDNLKRNGVMVLRTWMFSHETWHGFEITKGVYNEDQFALFDYVIEAARRTGIKLIPVFENYWEAYGGIDTRLEWEGLTGGHPGRAQFFDKTKCPGCFESYKNYVKYALNRVNHYSNIAYKDDPAIMAWELMNEPRYQDVSAQENKSGTTLRKWVDEMGAFIKSIDSNHLLGTGLEAHESALGFGGDEGNPFVYIHQSPYIDMTSAHPYTDEPWAGPMTLAQTLTFISKVIDLSHNTVKKPFFMGEFNFHSAGTDGAYNATLRAEWWSAVYDLLEQEEVAGSAFWWFSYANTDPTFGVANGDPILKVFVEHGNVLRVKNGDDEIALPTPTPSPVPQCEDVYPFPEDGYTCQQQAGWGKCSESWLQGYCNDSCGRCPGTGTASPTATPTGNTGCTDIAPDTEYTCAQQAEWGKCTEDWMEGWCLSSCGKCPSATITVPSTSSPTPTGDCVDVAPDNEYTCAQQAEWGKCTEDWMAGWCKKSCGTCPGMTTTTTTFPTCTATATPRASNAPIRVMALGDSITGSPGCWRAYLWQKLNQAGLSSMVDFVGTLKGQGCPNVPSYDGENEGHGGFLVTNVARDGSLINWLCSTFPDVVMMHFGTNDVWSSKSPAVILDAFTTLVNQMRANNPNVQIIVAQILPMNPTGCADCNSRVIAFNAAIPAWIEKTSTSRSPIVIVDQFSGFDTGANTGDGVHPNDSGNVKMADKMYPVLVSVLKSFGSGSSTTTTPAQITTTTTTTTTTRTTTTTTGCACPTFTSVPCPGGGSVVPRCLSTPQPGSSICQIQTPACPSITTTTTTTTTRTSTTSTPGSCVASTSTITLPASTVTLPGVTITVTKANTSESTRTTTTTTRTSTITTRTTTTTTKAPTDCSPKWGQCGGQGWTGATCCQSGSTCRVSNQYYSQCL